MRRSDRALTCPCVRAEKPQCREGRNCWHFGNNKGTCDHCHCTGYFPPFVPRRAVTVTDRTT